MSEWFSTLSPAWVLVAILALMSLLLVLVVIALVLLLSFVRRRHDEVGQYLGAIQQDVHDLRTSLEGTGPVRYALAGLLVTQKERQLSREELQEEIERLLRDYKDIDDIVDELKVSLLTLDDEAADQREPGKTGEAS